LAIGGGIGLLWGGGYGATRSQKPTKKIEFSLNESDLFEITKYLIAEVWTIAYYGFEKNYITPIKNERIEYLVDNEIPKLFKSYSIDNNNYKDNIFKILYELGV